jgi:hypothetical protein
MARILEHIETLVYYDGLQLFVAQDQLHLRYLCLLVDRKDNFDSYLCVPISGGRLGDLLSGNLDVRSAIETPETDEMYIGEASDDQYKQMEVSSISKDDIDSTWLPDPGFLLEVEQVSDIRVVEEAVKRKRAILHCSLNPPEARFEPKITAEHLGQAVKVVQRLVKHSFRKAVRGMDRNLRRQIDIPENYELEVFGFSASSFTLHMQSTAYTDLFGYSEIAKALNLIDVINQEVDNPQATVDVISQHGGHFATAYRNLLEFIVKNKIPLQYEWTMPELRKSSMRRISVKQAKPIYDVLIQREDIGREEKRLVGRVTKVDVRYKTWRLLSDEDEEEHTGKCDPDNDVTLAGITVKTQRYEFLCEEHLQEERGTGRESTELYLKSYRTLP